MLKKGLLLALTTAVAALGTIGSSAADEPFKVGFVYVSPIGDAGWTFQHDSGRKEMEKALSGKVASKYVENVPEGADAERVIRELAQSGNRIIFTTSFGYMNPTLKVAKQFPKTDFEHATGYKSDSNVGIYNARFYEGRYLAGIVAGNPGIDLTMEAVKKLDDKTVAGGAKPAGTAGTAPAAKEPEEERLKRPRGRPKAEVKVVWVNSWYDPGRERVAAETLVSQAADVLTHHTDSTAVVQAAEAKKVYSIGYHSDMSKYGPNTELTAVTHQWGAFYTKTVQEAMAGTWKPTSIWGGLKEGMIKMGPYNKIVPKDVQDQVNKVSGDIASGKFHPFTGPVKDNEGKERLAAGQVMSDEVLSKMDYYVEGVQGRLPVSK